jgi:hypothetical protein
MKDFFINPDKYFTYAGYLILAIGVVAFIIRYAKDAWKSIVNDED